MKYDKQYDFSLEIYMKEYSQNSWSRDKFTTKYFYDIFLKKKFTTPAIQIKYTKEFNLTKQDWENIYMNKIYRIKDKKIAEFNYKLINNILSNNYFVSKIEKVVHRLKTLDTLFLNVKMCKTCGEHKQLYRF